MTTGFLAGFQQIVAIDSLFSSTVRFRFSYSYIKVDRKTRNRPLTTPSPSLPLSLSLSPIYCQVVGIKQHLIASSLPMVLGVCCCRGFILQGMSTQRRGVSHDCQFHQSVGAEGAGHLIPSSIHRLRRQGRRYSSLSSDGLPAAQMKRNTKQRLTLPHDPHVVPAPEMATPHDGQEE